MIDLPVTTVYLSPDRLTRGGDWRFKLFYCNYCGNPVFKYVGLTHLILPGRGPVTMPIEVKCPNSKCNALFMVESIVGRDGVV